MNNTLTPALRSAGYRGPDEEFSRHAVRYEFKRPGSAGIETIAVLFNRDRTAQFSVQLYVEPLAGAGKLDVSGGELIMGTLSPRRSTWPFGVRAFGQDVSLLSRLFGRSSRSASQAVEAALALMPQIEAWWRDQRSTKYIVSSTVQYPGHHLRDR